jgi:hypothetical protein
MTGGIVGRAGSDRLRGADNRDNRWLITGTNSGQLNGSDFSGIQYLEGGNLADEFVMSDGGSLAGGLDGQAGAKDDTLTIDATSIGTTAEPLFSFEGGSGNDTIRGPTGNSNWLVTGSNAGSIGTFEFSEVENLIGASENDTLTGPDADTTWNVTGPPLNRCLVLKEDPGMTRSAAPLGTRIGW